MGRQRGRVLDRPGPTLRRDPRELLRPVPHRGRRARTRPCARRRLRQRTVHPRCRSESPPTAPRSASTCRRRCSRSPRDRRREGLDNVEFRHADAQIHPFESGGVRRRHLPHGFDVLRRSDRGIHQPPSRAAPRRSTHTPHLAGPRRQRVAHRVPRRLGRRPRPPDTTSRSPEPVHALRPRSCANHPRSRRLHRRLLPGPARTDELRTRPRRRVRLRQRTDRLDARRPRRAGRDARSALRATIADHTGDHGVTYRSATWIIKARKP